MPKGYIVGIREVHVSYRYVESEEETSKEDIIQLALDSDNELMFEYSHTLNPLETASVEEYK